MTSYFLKYIIAFFLFEIVTELFLKEHIPFDSRFVEIFIVCSNGIVGQMDKLVTYLLWIVINCWKSDIALIEKPDGQRVKISDKDPLSNIEFSLQHYQWILYIFLGNPQRLLAFNMILNFDKVIIAGNSSSSGQACRF